jgi:hypothetical protein
LHDGKSAARSITRTPASSSAGRLVHGDTVGGGEEDRIASPAAGRMASDRSNFRSRPSRASSETCSATVGAGVAPGSDGNDRHLWVLRQQAQQFDTGVARAADDSDLDHERLHDSLQ